MVGESGSGKTTLALALMRLIAVRKGAVAFLGRPICRTKRMGVPCAALRRDMQIVFQDPFGSLSPRMTAEEIIAEGLSVHGLQPGRNRRDMVAEVISAIDRVNGQS